MTNHPQTQDLLDFQAKLKSLHEITGILTQTSSFDDFCRLAIELGLSRLGFQRLGLWFLGPDRASVIGSFGTDEQGNIRDERGLQHPLLPEHLSGSMMQPGEGRTVLYDIPLLNDKTEVVGRGINVRGNLWDGEQVLGWLNGDNLIRHEPWSEYQIELLGLYASTLGHLVTRQRIEESLRVKEEEARQFQGRLKMLHEVTSELAQTHSFDDLCRRAVELGRSKLGFDRLGLWFLDSDPEYMVGSFGIDENGNIRDERNQRLRIRHGEHSEERLDGRVFAATRSDVPIYNDRAEIVGTGWKAVAQVWNGDRNIGWLATDNLLTLKPLRDYELELLSLYADTLGHLASVRKAEETLSAERSLFRTIIDMVPDQITVKDTEGRFILVNKAFWESVPQVSAEKDMIGKTDFEFFPRSYAERCQANDQQVIGSGATINNVEEPGRPQDDRSTTVLTTKVPLKDDLGRVIGLVGVAHDISDLKRIERQTLDMAIERERMNVLRDTITAISHDLRTPLTTLNFFVYLLERMSDPAQQKEKLEGIKQQLTLLEHRINEILLSVRLEQNSDPSRSPVNLNTLCQNALLTLQPLIDMRKLAVVTHWQPGLPKVLGDETALRQALDNLIQNAINYTPEGGTITLKTRIQGDNVSVEISDTGIGISENDLPYIFDHFFRADRSRSMNSAGMGLGLAIVKRIVEMHGGTIEVKSTVGQGTTFRVLLSILMKRD
jgi:PAS domain S-box-containing protein